MIAALAVAALGMARVGPGELRPLYGPKVQVAAFDLDRTPVTNGQFLAFLRGNPGWRRDRVPALFADGAYLARWAGPAEPGPAAPGDAPVVEVSWFAAQAYCRERGARLPTEAEWELAARADETRADASGDPRRTAAILAWYARPPPRVLPPVGQGRASVHGIQDLHGLVWEWVLDFGDTAVPGPAGAARFCGAAAGTAATRDDYAAFMRYALRSSLESRYTLGSLGFRCARGAEEKP